MRDFFKSLQWLEPVIELVRLGIFLVFLALIVSCVIAAVRRQPENVLRRRANLLIAYVLTVTTVVGIIQIDAWPFTNWALVHTMRKPELHGWFLEGIDANGRAWPVDLRILQPIAPEEFGGWWRNLPPMPPAERDRVMRFFLMRAEEARKRVRAGERYAPNEWLLGPLSAPYHFEWVHAWRDASDVPDVPFVSLRVIATTWDIHERRQRGEAAVSRKVYLEYQPDE